MKKKEFYIDPSDFFTETLHCIKEDKASDKLARMFLLLAERRINHRMFVRYVHIREDLISIGAGACAMKFREFRPNRNILIRDEEGEIIDKTKVLWDGEMIDYDYEKHYSPYSFFSKVIENDCLQFIKKEYYQRNVTNKIKLENGIDADYGYIDAMKEEGDNDKLFAETDESNFLAQETE